jgi:hypothetical protein
MEQRPLIIAAEPRQIDAQHTRGLDGLQFAEQSEHRVGRRLAGIGLNRLQTGNVVVPADHQEIVKRNTQALRNFGGDPPEDVLAGSGTLFADNANDPELGRFEDVLCLKKFRRLRLERSGLFEVPGLLEYEFLQLHGLGMPKMPESKVATYGFLMF